MTPHLRNCQIVVSGETVCGDATYLNSTRGGCVENSARRLVGPYAEVVLRLDCFMLQSDKMRIRLTCARLSVKAL